MDTPERLIQAMENTGSTETIWVKADFELERPPSIAEWTDATCRPVPSSHRQLKDDLEAKWHALEKKSKLPENELNLLRKIWDEESDHDRCQTILWDRNREKLPRP
jgi:hypothetical protein